MSTEIITDEDILVSLYNLARLLRNTDGLEPATWGMAVALILKTTLIPVDHPDEHKKALFAVFKDLARLSGNEDALQPSTWGHVVGQTLVKLRLLDGERYANDIMAI